MQVLEQEDGFRVESGAHFTMPLYLKKVDGWTIKTARQFSELTIDIAERAYNLGVWSIHKPVLGKRKLRG